MAAAAAAAMGQELPEVWGGAGEEGFGGMLGAAWESSSSECGTRLQEVRLRKRQQMTYATWVFQRNCMICSRSASGSTYFVAPAERWLHVEPASDIANTIMALDNNTCKLQ
jgi:hypothetical protein